VYRGEFGPVSGRMNGLGNRWPGAGRRGTTGVEKAQSLLDLAGHLQGVLVPVAPAAGFRRRLQGDLVVEAHRRQAAPEPKGGLRHRRAILIGAAALGSVASVVGVILTVVLHHRQSRTTRVAAQ